MVFSSVFRGSFGTSGNLTYMHHRGHKAFLLSGCRAVAAEEEDVPLNEADVVHVPQAEPYRIANRGTLVLRLLMVLTIAATMSARGQLQYALASSTCCLRTAHTSMIMLEARCHWALRLTWLLPATSGSSPMRDVYGSLLH